MSTEHDLETLTILNQIAETLNRATNILPALNSTLAQLVDLMGLHTGWIFLKDPHNQHRWGGRGYGLIATYNLPPGLRLDNPDAWLDGCECQGLCNKGTLTAAYNEVQCSRLGSVSIEERGGLAIHASTPLRSGERVLGILNVAAPDWSAFTPGSLMLLTQVGNMMGITLERARLYELLGEQRIHEQIALLDFSNQLLSRRDVDTLMNYLVEEARRLLQIDACSLMLPDNQNKTLYFRASSGWRENPVFKHHALPNDERSGPGLVMKTQQPLLVEDLEVDSNKAPWMADWLKIEHFRGHAIVPLVVEGRSLGTLIVDSRQPRMLNEDELRFLRLLANQAALALETARLHHEDLKLQRMREELAISQQIQLSMLPEKCPVIPGWEFVAKYKAARVVGGDFYDFFFIRHEPHMLGIVVADVADKGIPAALFMALSRTIIRSTALTGRNPAATLTRANEILLNDSHTDIFVTAFYAVLNTKTGEMGFSNGGHNRPFWYRQATGQFEKLNLRGTLMGAFPDIVFQEKEIQIEPGDFVLFYTDGVTEIQSAEGEEWGEKRFINVVKDHVHASAHQMLQAVIDAVNEFTYGTPLSDDFTLVILKRE